MLFYAIFNKLEIDRNNNCDNVKIFEEKSSQFKIEKLYFLSCAIKKKVTKESHELRKEIPTICFLSILFPYLPLPSRKKKQ